MKAIGEVIIPLSVFEEAKRKSSLEINVSLHDEFRFNKKALKLFRKMVKEHTKKRARKLFGFLNVFGLYVVPYANLNTRLYFEIHLSRFKWGCYLEGVRIWD